MYQNISKQKLTLKIIQTTAKLYEILINILNMNWLYYFNSIYKKIDSYDFIKNIQMRCFIQINVSMWKN
jgi:hypothetical protein